MVRFPAAHELCFVWLTALRPQEFIQLPAAPLVCQQMFVPISPESSGPHFRGCLMYVANEVSPLWALRHGLDSDRMQPFVR